VVGSRTAVVAIDARTAVEIVTLPTSGEGVVATPP
jgi:hypothetical protein